MSEPFLSPRPSWPGERSFYNILCLRLLFSWVLSRGPFGPQAKGSLEKFVFVSVCFFQNFKLIRYINRTRAKRFAVLNKLDPEQIGVYPFAKLIVLKPEVDNGVNVTTGVRLAVFFSQWGAIPVNHSGTFLGCGLDYISAFVFFTP